MTDLLSQFSGGTSPEQEDPLLVSLRETEAARRATILQQSQAPDTAGRANVLSRETGLPPTIVEQNLPTFEAQQRATHANGIMAKYPAIGKWSADPRNVAVAADDYDALGSIGKAMYFTKGIGKAFVAGSYDALGGGAGFVRSMAENAEANNPISWAEKKLFGASLESLIGGGATAIQRVMDAKSKDWQVQSGNRMIDNTLQGIQSVPTALAGLGVGIVAGPTAGASVMGGVVAGGEYDKARTKGLSPFAAAGYSNVQGAIEVLTEHIPASRLLTDIANRSPIAKTLMRQIVAEIPGEQAATFLQDLNEWATLHPEKSVKDFIAERPGAALDTAIATIAGVGAHVGIATAAERTASVAEKVLKRVEQSRQAQDAGVVLDGLGEGSTASKLRTRDPEAFAALIREMASDTGHDTAYIPVEAVQTYMQSEMYKGEFSDWQDQIDEAAATGGDVVLPLETAVTRLAGTPAWDALKDDMRLSAGGMSRKEALTFDEGMADHMADLSDSVAAEQKSAAEAAAPREKLLTTITDKIMNGGYTPKTARDQGEILTQRAVTRTTRMGREVTGAELDDLQINQILPAPLAAAQKADQLDMTISVMQGKSKSAALDTPLTEAADALRGLLDNRGIDPDKASRREVRAAVDAYVAEQEGGLSFSQASDVAYTAEGMPIARGPDAVAAFERWFGDSKVISAGGAPLTLFHGTTADIEAFNKKKRASSTGSRDSKYGFFLTSDPDVASEYSTLNGGDGANVVPVVASLQNPLAVDMAGKVYDEQLYLSLIFDAKDGGHDGLILRNVEDGPFRTDRPSTTFIAFEPEQIKSVHNGGSFSMDDARILYQSFNDSPRGKITFPAAGFGTGPSIISLFQSRDQSTFLHETGHLWLEELRYDASDPDAPDELRNDWRAVTDWFAANGHSVENGMIPVEAHELWARGVERYLMEGKAPVPALRKIFQNLKAWLVQVYRSVDKLKAPITDDIRAVMDRLIATDEEIAAAAQQQNIEALFPEKPAMMTAAEFEAYTAQTLDARDAAHDALLAKVMAGVKRRVTKEYKDRAETVREEITVQVDSRPEFRALRVLKDSPMDSQWLKDTYGEDVASLLPKQVPPVHRVGGANADEVAERSGFTSGDEMVRTLMGVETRRRELKEGGDQRSVRKALIEQEVNAIMLERYGDPFTDGSIEEEALAAVHNDRQGEVIAAELRVLARSTGQRVTPYSIAKDWAARSIREGIVRDVSSRSAIQRYQRAATKAGKAAMDAAIKGDSVEAFRQKQAQMLNNALISEASKAADEVEAAVERMGKIAKRRTMKSVDQDYLERAHSLLEQVDLKERSQRSIDRQDSYEAWAAEQEAAGHDLAVPPSFAQTLGTTNWSRLSVENLLGLDDAVKQIIHLGRFKQTLIDGKIARDHNEVVQEAKDAGRGMKRKPPSDLLEPSWVDRIKSNVASADAALLKMETIFDWLDQGDSNGVFNRIVFRPIADAQDSENVMLADYYGQVKAAFDGVGKKQLRRWADKFSDPALANPKTGNPLQMTRQGLIALALNTGNAGNMQRVTDGYGWNEGAVRELLNRELSAEDWAFVQQVWDIVETLWPQTAAMERRINGVEPDKVEAVPVVTPHGTLRGGYYPAIYDSARSTAAEAHEGKASEMFGMNYTRANTRASSTKERSEKVKRPILLQLGVINRHLGEVIHDITHREAVMQADKFLSDGRIVDLVDETLGHEIRKQFRPWLKFVANQWAIEKAGNEGIGKFIGKVRANTTIVGMGFRATTVLTQVAGYANSFEYVGASWVAAALAKTTAHPIESFRFVMEKSGEVRDRMNTLDRDLSLMIKNMAGDNKISNSLSAAKRFAFHGIGYADRLVVIPTWIGAYDKALSQNMSDKDAIYAADKAVRMAQGSGSVKDLAAIQRGTGKWGEFLKLTAMFYSYMSAVYQRQRTLGRDAANIRSVRDLPNVMARSFWLMMVPPVLSQILSGSGPEDDDDWGVWTFKQMLFQMLGPIPVVRDLARPIWDKAAGNKGFDYQISPVQRAGQTLVNVAGDVSKLVQGEETKRATRDIMEGAGYLTGIVPGQIATSTQFLVDVGEGEQDPETFAQWYEGLTKGKVSED